MTQTDESEIPEPYRSAHKECSQHRQQLLASRWAGCFYCLQIFAPMTVRDWIDDDQTALCPVCGIDSVMPLTAEQFESEEFLPKMRAYWFAPTPEGPWKKSRN